MIEGFISRRLSGKLLVMTIIFVMAAEILLFIPSVADFRDDWLEDRAERAGHLTLALTGVPDYEGSEILSERFMTDTDIVMLLTKREGMTELVLGSPPENARFEKIDLREKRWRLNFPKTFQAFFGSGTGYLRVVSDPFIEEQDWLEYIAPKTALQQDMRDYFQRIFLLSLFIALVTGLLLYLALSAMIVRPIRQLAQGLSDFREDPEKRRSNQPPSARKDEIGQLQREFYDMKQSVRSSLRQQDRLATLGMAVAKINHDLRNILTSAHLVSDRIAMDKDERVSNMGQRLVRAIDRGVKLCGDVLNFSQSKDDPPDFEPVRISLLLGEVAADVLGSFGTGPRAIQFNNTVPTDLTLSADPDHTYRIFHNLFRNAAQAMAAIKDDTAARALSTRLEITEGQHIIHIGDTGPGIPEKARANLFKAFVGASGHGSTGLGLTISKELARAQGGDIALESTGPDGTVFSVMFGHSGKV